ncbi:hypothetical protein [Alteromonas oceanisediminis]
MIANTHKTTLHIGVTSNLARRIHQYKNTVYIS